MERLVLGLIPLALLIAWPLTAVVRRVSVRASAYDSGGVAGQVKAARRRIPNTGGIAIFWAVVLPLAGLLMVLSPAGRYASEHRQPEFSWVPADLWEHLPRMEQQAPLAWLLVGSLGLLHVMGLVDDRRPLGAWVKMGLMALPCVGVPLITSLTASELDDTRLLTVLDGAAGGAWASIALTALWLLVVTNALNFMDNMDGLSAGVAVIAGGCFLAAALIHGQWFVGACLALMIGACVGFLIFNFPPASIFMGDGGSVVLGFLLGFLTVRTTYVQAPAPGASLSAWYGVFMPLCVLAVPIYDFVSVVAIRLSQGRSPLVGDLQHLSHRLEGRGLSRRGAVVVIWGFTLVTGVSGIVLGSLSPWQAVLVGGQVVAMLVVVALFEYGTSKGGAA